MRTLDECLDDVRADARETGAIQIAYWYEHAGRMESAGRINDIPAGWESATQVADPTNPWIVYPSGLALPFACVNLIWEFENDVRIGSAQQVVRYCQRMKLDPNTVFPVPEERVHGTCARYDTEDSYRLVQARSLPHWTVVR